MFDAVVLAGTAKPSELTEREGVENKAFIRVSGKTLLAYTLEALRSSALTGRIVVVGPKPDLSPLSVAFGFTVVEERGDLPENILAGVLTLSPSRHFLVMSADIPFLTKEALEDFLERCQPRDKDFYYPIVARADSEKRFPGMKRTYVRLKEGVFTGGNLFLVNPDVVEKSLPRFRRFIELRKSPLKLLAKLGPAFLIKFLCRILTISELEKKFPDLLGISGKAVITPYAEIGADVDKPGDLDLVRAWSHPKL
jgi:molybdopterin-guanine dinucleotide biosynthesis protein A